MRPSRALAATLVVAALGVAAPAGAQDRPATAARLDANFDVTPKATTVLSARVVGASVGTTAKLACRGGADKGCPKALRGRTRTVRAMRAGGFSVRSKLKGAVLTVTVTDPGSLFRRETFSFGRPGSYTQVTRCEAASGPPSPCL